MIELFNVYFYIFLFLFLFFSLWHTNDQSSADAVSHVFNLLSQILLDPTSLRPEECRQILCLL